MAPLRLAVLASGRGSNLQAILAAIAQKELPAEVVAVISDREQAVALERARALGFPAVWVNPREYASRESFEQELLDRLDSFGADFIVLAGFMRILSAHFIRGARVPILNIHPSLLPSFPGLHAQRQALDYGVRFSGCTVHFVDEGVDSGPIMLQAVVPVLPDDTEDSLSRRILEQEHQLYPQVIKLLSSGRIKCLGRKVIISGEDV